MHETKNFIQIKPEQLNKNVFDLISIDWMLITARNANCVNTMTASWGGFGTLWNKNVAFFFVRPQRYTFSILENSELSTLCFFDKKKNPDAKKILNFCGKTSGKKIDKIKESGLTLAKNGSFDYYEEASLVICCKKLYSDFFFSENFSDKTLISKNYPNKDFHKIFISEIIKILKE